MAQTVFDLNATGCFGTNCLRPQRHPFPYHKLTVDMARVNIVVSVRVNVMVRILVRVRVRVRVRVTFRVGSRGRVGLK